MRSLPTESAARCWRSLATESMKSCNSLWEALSIVLNSCSHDDSTVNRAEESGDWLGRNPRRPRSDTTAQSQRNLFSRLVEANFDVLTVAQSRRISTEPCASAVNYVVCLFDGHSSFAQSQTAWAKFDVDDCGYGLELLRLAKSDVAGDTTLGLRRACLEPYAYPRMRRCFHCRIAPQPDAARL
jgi:hypothetical protein